MVRHPMTMSVQLLMLRNPQTAFTLLSFMLDLQVLWQLSLHTGFQKWDIS